MSRVYVPSPSRPIPRIRDVALAVACGLAVVACGVGLPLLAFALLGRL